MFLTEVEHKKLKSYGFACLKSHLKMMELSVAFAKKTMGNLNVCNAY